MCRFRVYHEGGGSSVAKRPSGVSCFVDKGSSLPLALFLVRKMHAIHRRIIGLQRVSRTRRRSSRAARLLARKGFPTLNPLC
jgi:hypothetical protein